MIKRFAIVAVAAFIGLASLTAQPASAQPYTLQANGVWVSSDGLYNGTWQGNFDVAGYDLTGTLNLIGMPGIASGNVSGTWDLSQLGFGIMFLDQELITFDGGLQGTQFAGNFETADFSGTWSGLLTSLRLSTSPIEPVFDSSIPTLVLGHNVGSVGDILNLVGTLYTAGEAIDKLDNILSFDPSRTPILSLNGNPNCSTNPLVNPAEVLFEFLPHGCSGSACNQVRAVLDDLSDLGPFLNGVALFTCKVGITSGTQAGVYNIVVSALQAFDVDDFQVNFNSIIGQIAVKAKKAAKKFGCDCSIMEASQQVPLASMLAPLAILALRRFQTRSSRKQGNRLQA
jgi:hypothetical protein